MIDQIPSRERSVELTVIIPFLNEEETLPILLKQLEISFSDSVTRIEGIGKINLLFINDGSSDGSMEFLLSQQDGAHIPFTVICLSRNFGHQAALAAGIDACTGDVIAIIDADLQDSPEEILNMLKEWRKGADIVYAVRRKRKEALWKQLAYKSFYKTLNFLSEGLIPADSGDFSLFDFKVVEAIRCLPERIRFFRGLRAWVGFTQKEHIYERKSRAAGVPKYNFKRLYKLATDGIISSSIRPLRLTQVFCIGSFIFAAICVMFALFRLMTVSNASESIILAYIILAAVGVMGFFTLMGLYVMSAYLGRLFIEVKARPTYIIANVHSKII